jgi:hypothetical protein
VKLPITGGGFLILQWGSIPLTASAPFNASFPIAFPNVCQGVLADVNNANGSYVTRISVISATGFTGTAAQSLTGDIGWHAWGW